MQIHAEVISVCVDATPSYISSPVKVKKTKKHDLAIFSLTLRHKNCFGAMHIFIV